MTHCHGCRNPIDRAELNEPLERIHTRELDYMKDMMSSHREVAVAAALDYCSEHQICSPEWLVTAAAEVMCDLLKRERPTRRGRAGSSIARYRQDIIDFDRWDTVLEVLRNQKKLVQEVELCRTYPDQQKLLQDRERMLRWVGRGWLRAYECAAMMLTGGRARASPESMKASYRKVNRNFANPTTATRYHLLNYQFLRKLGIQYPGERRPGTKTLPLYDLTL